MRMSLGRWYLLRARAASTNADLARLTGISAPTLSQLANGHVEDPTRRHALALRKHLGIRVEAWDEQIDSADPIFDRPNAESRRTDREGDDMRKDALLAALAVIGARDSSDVQRREAYALLETFLGQGRVRIDSKTNESTAPAPLGDHL